MEEQAEILDRFCFSETALRELDAFIRRPLQELGLSIFDFTRVYDDGTAFILYSDPRVGRYVVQEQEHLAAHVPQALLSRRFWYLPESASYSKLTRDIKILSGSSSWVDYFERTLGYFDMFCFWTQKDADKGATQFLNLKEQLEYLCDQFKRQARQLIQQADQDRFSVPKSMLPNFGGLRPNSKLPYPTHAHVSLSKFQRDLCEIASQHHPRLTARELECVQQLVLGKTAKDIADGMRISYRTVEMNIDNARAKLNCLRKSEIIETLVSLGRSVERVSGTSARHPERPDA